MEWLVPGITALGVAILVPTLQWLSSLRKEKRVDFLTDFKSIVALLKAELASTTQELTALRSRVAHLEALCDTDVPYPVWSLDLAGCYRWVNKSFQDQVMGPLGKGMTDLIGKTPSEVWAPEIAAVLNQVGSKPGFNFDPKLKGTRFLYQHSLYHGPRPIGTLGIAPPE